MHTLSSGQQTLPCQMDSQLYPVRWTANLTPSDGRLGPEPAGGINTAKCFAGSHLDLQKHQLRSNSIRDVFTVLAIYYAFPFYPEPLTITNGLPRLRVYHNMDPIWTSMRMKR